MYMVASGKLKYFHPHQLEDDDGLARREDWACEACLWTEWYALGELSAKTECKLVSIDANAFRQVIEKEFRVWTVVSAYARCYVTFLCNVPRRGLTDVWKAEDKWHVCNGFVKESVRSTGSGMFVPIDDQASDAPAPAPSRTTSGQAGILNSAIGALRVSMRRTASSASSKITPMASMKSHRSARESSSDEGLTFSQLKDMHSSGQ
jgi:hypothetical protein